jgi:hypothetical protein
MKDNSNVPETPICPLYYNLSVIGLDVLFEEAGERGNEAAAAALRENCHHDLRPRLQPGKKIRLHFPQKLGYTPAIPRHRQVPYRLQAQRTHS